MLIFCSLPIVVERRLSTVQSFKLPFFARAKNSLFTQIFVDQRVAVVVCARYEPRAALSQLKAAAAWAESNEAAAHRARDVRAPTIGAIDVATAIEADARSNLRQDEATFGRPPIGQFTNFAANGAFALRKHDLVAESMRVEEVRAVAVVVEAANARSKWRSSASEYLRLRRLHVVPTKGVENDF